jgi:hypothetical protein
LPAAPALGGEAGGVVAANWNGGADFVVPPSSICSEEARDGLSKPGDAGFGLTFSAMAIGRKLIQIYNANARFWFIATGIFFNKSRRRMASCAISGLAFMYL